ncbi:MAG: hypothetical protein ABJ360_04655 [Roseobacter sp.]
MATMPDEHVDHMFGGHMGPESIHFLAVVLLDTKPMVAPEHAGMMMECYLAADISAETGDPILLPLSDSALAQLADIKAVQSDK